MKLRSFVVLVVSLILAACTTVNTEERTNASRETVKQMAEKMKGTMKETMKSGGPIKAIEVCRTKAPKMAAMMSEKKGWEISRTSLKTRNPDNNPDVWELSALLDFEKRKEKGEDIKKMEYTEVVTEGGNKYFRYMKAIPTAAPCLTCHGSKIDSKLEAKINELYPQDTARGFSAGDIRGAFSIKQPL
ncbi:MAG: DUF3365 domain-containing protein [Proteobacteria bacterium]|nr:DUF3365 domain-containing protein [Pseudomonadota bacterium]